MREALQLLLVLSAGWDAVPATMQRYERAPGRPWRAVGAPIAVSLGRSGLGWGTGVHPAPPLGPLKAEGDGRSPAGAYKLETAFGNEKPETKMPFIRSTPDVECIDDVKSKHYGHVVDRRKVPHPDWHSSERMLRSDDLYQLGIIVEHNGAHVAGDGSCIFLHVRNTPDTGTAGCTAMERDNLVTLLKWLDPAKQPLLVQLPKPVYQQLKQPWQLP